MTKRKKVGFTILTIVVLVICGVILLAMNGCNKQLIDTTWKFDYVNIRLQTGEVISGEVSSWNDYEGDQLQIKLKDGSSYLVHSSNVDLYTK